MLKSELPSFFIFIVQSLVILLGQLICPWRQSFPVSPWLCGLTSRAVSQANHSPIRWFFFCSLFKGLHQSGWGQPIDWRLAVIRRRHRRGLKNGFAFDFAGNRHKLRKINCAQTTNEPGLFEPGKYLMDH
jgi:hypothetical protein